MRLRRFWRALSTMWRACDCARFEGVQRSINNDFGCDGLIRFWFALYPTERREGPSAR